MEPTEIYEMEMRMEELVLKGIERGYFLNERDSGELCFLVGVSDDVFRIAERNYPGSMYREQ